MLNLMLKTDSITTQKGSVASVSLRGAGCKQKINLGISGKREDIQEVKDNINMYIKAYNQLKRRGF